MEFGNALLLYRINISLFYILDFERLPDTNYIEQMKFIGFLASPHTIEFYIKVKYSIEKYGGQTWFPMSVKNIQK
jgi:hypothetical protein